MAEVFIGIVKLFEAVIAVKISVTLEMFLTEAISSRPKILEHEI